ncbi:Predicted tubulin-tyrosine ligase [Phaffia rhodozyma]|uniref:Predicted tubulin-tyrosine ligase n=1 Tax=Phaffia rhodozyma TaxID=264483 RepID=A0A0F7SIZ8_PHARH|nr:Predicted tubulin-tyrosine ligase [Phaffia rhodozyma]
MSTKRLRVLLTNDDGPPSTKESPNIFSFARALEKTLGWDVKVVVPSSQKSWIGKAYQIQDNIAANYYYPTEPEGAGEKTPFRRPLKEGEVGEWILLDGTPATCTNISLFNLYPGEIDLVISGPNFGRNSSSAFSLSSGTIGAALSGSLSRTRSIALSYGIMNRTFTPESLRLANIASVEIIRRLWEDWGVDTNGWASRKEEIDLYSVNLPLVEEKLKDPRVFFTRVWRNNYASLFKPLPSAGTKEPVDPTNPPADEQLVFHFKPDMHPLINPLASTVPVGTDTWAIDQGYISVCPLRACFAAPEEEGMQLGSGIEVGPQQGLGKEWVIDWAAAASPGDEGGSTKAAL